MNKKGLSLLEIIISAIILAMITTALVSVFMIGKWNILRSRSRITAAELWPLSLDALQVDDVRQDQWSADKNCLTSNGSSPDCVQQGAAPQPLNNVNYSQQYNITPLGTVDSQYPLGHLRKVTVTIQWPRQNQ